MSTTLSGVRRATLRRKQAETEWRQAVAKAALISRYEEVAQAAGITKGRVSQIAAELRALTTEGTPSQGN